MANPMIAVVSLNLPRVLRSENVLITLAALGLWVSINLGVRLWLRFSDKLTIIEKHRARRFAISLTTPVVLVVLMITWNAALQNFAVAFAAFVVAFTIGVKEILMCVLGWVYRIITDAYDIGDRIKIEDYRGDVIETGLFSTKLLETGHDSEQSTGRIITVPHSLLLTKGVANETRRGGIRWLEITLPVQSYEQFSQMEQLFKEHLEQIHSRYYQEVRANVERMQGGLALKVGNLDPRIYLSQDDKFKRLFIIARIAIPPRMAREVRDEILRRIHHTSHGKLI